MQEKKRYQLTLFSDAGTLRVPMNGDRPLVIGRSSDCDIPFDAKGISRRHCRVTALGAGRFKVEDLGSTNGILVGDRRMESAEVGLLERVRIGSAAFIIEELAKEAPATAPSGPPSHPKTDSGPTTVSVDIRAEDLSPQVYRDLAEAYHHQQKELARVNAELEKSLQELKDTQALLLQQEKMAALGTLTAGVAHEFNNPIAAAASAAEALPALLTEFARAETAIRDLALEPVRVQAYLDLRRALFDADRSAPFDPSERRRRRSELTGEAERSGVAVSGDAASLLDLPTPSPLFIAFLRAFEGTSAGEPVRALAALDAMLSKIHLIRRSTGRVVGLVHALKGYSHLDKATWGPVDLRQGLEDTLTILQHWLKHGVEVVRDFKEVPKVPGNAGELNQVWTNLIINALDAMGGKGTLTLRLGCEGEAVRVSIEDTGPGIPPERLTRIFDPFYTTKAPGKGTGLGLKICKDIVERHGGSLAVDSRPEKTVLTVTLHGNVAQVL